MDQCVWLPSSYYSGVQRVYAAVLRIIEARHAVQLLNNGWQGTLLPQH